MRTRQAQQLMADVYARLDEATGTSATGFAIGVKPAPSDLLEWLNQEWADLYDHLIDADTKWNLQQSTFATVGNQDAYSLADGAWWGTIPTVTLLGGGAGYTAAPNITFTGGTTMPTFFRSPIATATVSGGVITGIQVTAPGYGYLTAPTVVITPTAGGAGANARADLQGAFYKSMGVDIQVQGSPSQWFPAHRFQFEERNHYSTSDWSWPRRILYDVWGGTGDPVGNSGDGTYLKFLPMPGGTWGARHWWYPAPARMALVTDCIDGVNGAELAMIFGACQAASLQLEQFEAADRFAQLRAEKWARIVSTLRDRNVGEAPMARVVRGRQSNRMLRGRWWGP